MYILFSGLSYAIADESSVHVIKEPVWSKDSLPIFMSMVVLSAPKHFDQRREVREEFELIKSVIQVQHGQGKRVVLTFLLGTVQCPQLAKQLNAEHEAHGDIFQVFFFIFFSIGDF